jgi:hypothetical protein
MVLEGVVVFRIVGEGVGGDGDGVPENLLELQGGVVARGGGVERVGELRRSPEQ